MFGQFGQTTPEPSPEPDPEEFKARLKNTSHILPDLHSQLESLLDQVWDSEERERLMDRVYLACRLDEWRERMRKRDAK